MNKDNITLDLSAIEGKSRNCNTLAKSSINTSEELRKGFKTVYIKKWNKLLDSNRANPVSGEMSVNMKNG